MFFNKSCDFGVLQRPQVIGPRFEMRNKHVHKVVGTLGVTQYSGVEDSFGCVTIGSQAVVGWLAVMGKNGGVSGGDGSLRDEQATTAGEKTLRRWACNHLQLSSPRLFDTCYDLRSMRLVKSLLQRDDIKATNLFGDASRAVLGIGSLVAVTCWVWQELHVVGDHAKLIVGTLFGSNRSEEDAEDRQKHWHATSK